MTNFIELINNTPETLGWTLVAVAAVIAATIAATIITTLVKEHKESKEDID